MTFLFAKLSAVCPPEWYLPTCMMSSRLYIQYDVCLPGVMSSCLYDVCRSVQYDCWLLLRCLLICTMAAQCSPVWCPATYMMSAQVYGICLPERCLATKVFIFFVQKKFLFVISFRKTKFCLLFVSQNDLNRTFACFLFHETRGISWNNSSFRIVWAVILLYTKNGDPSMELNTYIYSMNILVNGLVKSRVKWDKE